MRWLIDGYNVIRRDPELAARDRESLEAGRVALLHRVARIASGSSDTFTVVFDGARRGGDAPTGGRVEVVFSRPPEKADDVLMRLAATLRDGAVVVTSDRAVQTAAQRVDAAAVGAEDFLDAALAADGGAVDGEDEDDAPRSKRGNPRRASKVERAAQRALHRLRSRR